MDNKIEVYFATKLRGFFKHISESDKSNIKFFTDKETFEVTSKNKTKFLKIYRSSLFNKLGVIRQIKAKDSECDYVGSFNRFVKTNKEYFIYLENPTALYEYCIGRNKSFLGAKRLKKLLNDNHLVGIVCMSKACYNTLEEVLCKLPQHILVDQIYPYVPINNKVNNNVINNKINEKELRCLYIAQGQRFISKGALEIIEVFERLKGNYINNIKLTMITSIEDIDNKIMEKIKSNENINLLNFNLDYSELQDIYLNSHILLHPTSDDSSPSTVLEAIKSGVCIISTNLYAIPEMVNNNFNGYLTKPKFDFFDDKNIPNKAVWNNREKTIYSYKVDERIVDFLYDKICYLDENRLKLKEMSINSLKVANNNEFGERAIIEKWNKFFSDIKSRKDSKDIYGK